MSLICPGPTIGGGGSSLTLESSATAGDRTASQNTFTRVDTTAGDVFITLPATGASGDRIAVANEIGTNAVIVQPDTGDTLDGIVDGAWWLKAGEVFTWVFDGVDTWVRESRSTISILNLDQTGDDYIESTPSTLDFYRGGALRWSVAGAGITSNLPIIPGTTDLFDLGTLALAWRAIYLAEGSTGLVLDADGGTRLYATTNSEWRLQVDGNNYIAGNESGEAFQVVTANGVTLAVNTARVRARAGNAQELGELGRAFGALYLAEAGTGLVLDADGDTFIFSPVDDNIDFFTGSVRQLRITQTEIQNYRQITTFNGIAPNAAGGNDVGTLALPYRAVYLQENGTGLVLDADGNTKLLATSDDVWQLQRGGATTYMGGYSGEPLLLVEAGATIYSLNTTRLRVPSGGTVTLGELARPLGAVYLNEGGTGLVLDADGDSRLVGTADDVAQWFFGGVRRATWGSGSFDFNVPLRPESNNGTTLGGDFRGWASLYLGSAGTYTAAVSEVAPADPNAQSIIFKAEGPGASKELWVKHDDGTTARLDRPSAGITVDVVSGFITCNDASSGSPSMPTDGTAFKLQDSDGDGNIDYDPVTGRWTLKADTPYALHAEIRGVAITGDVAKYQFYNVTGAAYFGIEGFNQEENRSTGAMASEIAVAQIRPATDIEVELRNTSGTSTGTYTGEFSKAWIFSTGGNITAGQARSNFAVESIEGAVGSAPGGTFGTSDVDYLEFRQGLADTINFQFIASGDCAVDLVYAMSAANSGDVDLRVDSLVVSNNGDPDGALSTGTVATFVPGADTNRHLAESSLFEIAANDGDLVKVVITRPATDTHTGDVRVLDIRVRASASGLATEADTVHEIRDQLVHAIAEDSYEEVTYASGKVSGVTVYTNVGKTTKIRETAYTYSGASIATVTTTQYDVGGVAIVGQTMTETFTYSAGDLQSIDRAMA